MEFSDYQRIEKAIRYLEIHAEAQPSLEELAAHLELSPYHVQKLFSRWAGVSPKRFVQCLTLERAKELLRDSASVLDTAYEVGLSGTGRLHDLFVTLESVTPGQYKSGGAGLEIRYGFRHTPFGLCLAATTVRGLCRLVFLESGGTSSALDELRRDWSEALCQEDSETVGLLVDRIFAPAAPTPEKPFPLLVKGTNFQIRVWQALLRIPEGAIVSYSDLAGFIGCPSAVRAVAGAVGRNPLAWIIPCHRVLRSTGAIGGYRWGTTRKRAMLAREMLAHDEPWPEKA